MFTSFLQELSPLFKKKKLLLIKKKLKIETNKETASNQTTSYIINVAQLSPDPIVVHKFTYNMSIKGIIGFMHASL